jgi:gamma-glutamylcyclotransferase
MSDRWYFAYGSNLAIDQKERRTGPIREIRRARLDGYRIVFNKLGSDGMAKANIRPDGTCVVWGVAYLCNPMALKHMDEHEGVPSGHYNRKCVQVQCDSGDVLEAITYVASGAYVRSSIAAAPEYLQRIISGARSHGLPENYVEEIERAARNAE